jgi:hypothetical protein
VGVGVGAGGVSGTQVPGVPEDSCGPGAQVHAEAIDGAAAAPAPAT